MDGDPIVALATSPGRSAVAVLRVSGHGCGDVLRLLTGRPLFSPRVATLVDVALGEGFSDRALATWFPAPHSYSGEDCFELAVHGSPVVIAATLEILGRQGVRGANPGEFTARAFLNGKVDLVEAEAIDDLVRAVTPAQARMASAHLHGALSGPLREIADGLLEILERLEASLDFPDEGYHFIDADGLIRTLDVLAARCAALRASGERGRILREGASVVIAGRPNVGKSSLFNALLGASRAIVTELPGTTRDLLSETIDIGGVPVTLTDTAGLRESADVVEREGVARARATASDADLVLMVVDAMDAGGVDEARAGWELYAERPRVLAVNKCDLVAGGALPDAWVDVPDACVVSATSGTGLDELRLRIAEGLGATDWQPSMITNGRHVALLVRVHEALARAIEAVRAGATEEYVALDMREALHALEEIRGRVTADELLKGIFARFCIGK